MVGVKPEEVMGGLESPESAVRLASLRILKNQVIGNRNKKLAYLDMGAIPKVVSIMADGTDTALLIQSAAAVGSFTYGVEAGVQAVLDSDGIAHLINTLSHLDEKVVEAGMRSLKMVYQSPMAPREKIFEEEALGRLLSLLADPNRATAEVAARILGRCCRDTTHQQAVLDSGGLELILPLLEAPRWTCREAGLQVLVSLTRENPKACAVLLKKSSTVITTALALAKEHRPSLQLVACSLLTHVACSCLPNASNLPMIMSGDNGFTSLRVAVLPILMKLLGEAEVRESVPRVISRLVEEKEELQKLAADADAINKLASFLTDEECSCTLMEGTLHALGTLCLTREESRKKLLEAKVLVYIVRALDHSNAGIREAACLCVRSLSRTMKQQRTALVDADVATPLLKLLRDPSGNVQLMASATVCNMLLDFSQVKEQVLKHDGAMQLVELTKSMDHNLRRNAVCALKNLVYQADAALKMAVLEILGWSSIRQLIDDDEEAVSVEALHMLMNLLHRKTLEIETVIQAAGGPQALISVLGDKIAPARSPSPAVSKPALMALSNIATGNEEHKELLLTSGIPEMLMFYLQQAGPENESVRLAVAWIVINLTFIDGSATEEQTQAARSRAERLQASGIQSRLLLLRDDPSQDMQERVLTALKSFEALLERPT